MSDPKTSTSIAIIPTDVGGFVDLASRFAKSALLPDALRSKPDDVFVTLLAGHELGLPPMAALRGIHVIKGKPILTADTMVAIVLSSGSAEYFSRVDESDDSATYETKRKGAPTAQRATWTLADAKRAGLLSNDNWTKNPRAMCRARAKSILARDVYPDVLAGCYEEGEADEMSGAPASVMQALPTMKRADAAPVVDVPAKTEAPAFDFALAIAQAKNVGELEAVGKRIAAEVPEADRARFGPSYKARLAVLNGPDLFAAFLADLAGMIGAETAGWSADDVALEFVDQIRGLTTLTEVNAAALPWIQVASKPGRGPVVRNVKAAIEAAAEARRVELRGAAA